MDENKESVVSSNFCKDEVDDWHSTDSKESQDSKEGAKLDSKKETKWTDFRKKRVNKKVTEKDNKPDLNRFSGDGTNFKAKLIGIKEVSQARGDRLAQDALYELKASVKALNTHKQKIIVNVSLEGIKIKDEKGVEVHHWHPVHKISFIAQDIADPRAFGYVFGSPSLGHKFFAIKTEKAAQLLVVAMRDLFHVVFEMRKKALQNNAKAENNNIKSSNGNVVNSEQEKNENSSCVAGEDEVDNLLDLNDQANEGMQKFMGFDDDFFGNAAVDKNDSFFSDPLNFINAISPSTFSDSTDFNNALKKNTVENGHLYEKDPFSPNQESQLHTENSVRSNSFSNNDFSSTVKSVTPDLQSNPNSEVRESPSFETDRYAPLANLTLNDKELTVDAFEPCSFNEPANDFGEFPNKSPATSELSAFENKILQQSPERNDFFSDLDPLGKDRPFVDRKDFFHEVKNPPKKVLKDLLEGTRASCSSQSSDSSHSSDSGLFVSSPSEASTSPQFPINFSMIDSVSAESLKESPSLAQSSSNEKSNKTFPFMNPFTCNPNNTSNAFDDPFFSAEFQLPSPKISPPPPPQMCIPPHPVVLNGPPIPPPRPVTTFPPPIPPKRTQTLPIPEIKLIVSGGQKQDVMQEDINILNNMENILVKSAGTLPIPIPSRRGCSDNSVTLSTNSKHMSIPSTSPSSSFSMSCDSSDPSCPPNSLNSVSIGSASSLLSSNSSYALESTNQSSGIHAKSITPASGTSTLWVNEENLSLPVNRIANLFPRIPSQGFPNKFSCDIALSSVSSINDNDNNNHSHTNGIYNDFINNDSLYTRQFPVSWNAAFSKNNQNSIFQRNTDPFADDFFQTQSANNSEHSFGHSIEVQNKVNQVPRIGNPFVSQTVKVVGDC